MSRSLIIRPDGSCTPSDEEPDVLARRHLATTNLDVVVAAALGRERPYVLYIDDWGRTNGRPVNRRAWAIYGRSPICGTAVLAADDHQPIDPAIVAMLLEDDFPPANVTASMDAWLEANPL